MRLEQSHVDLCTMLLNVLRKKRKRKEVYFSNLNYETIPLTPYTIKIVHVWLKFVFLVMWRHEQRNSFAF